MTTSSTPIRDWARANGFEVGSRGTLPAEVVQAYCVAHNIGEARIHPALQREPRRPPKPRVSYDVEAGWIVQTGAIDVRVPSWDAGLSLAQAICSRYARALQQYQSQSA